MTKFRDDKLVKFESEQAVIGGILQDPSCMASVELVPDDFAIHAHREVYRALSSMFSAGDPIDLVTVAEYLDRIGELDKVGGLPKLLAIVESTPTSANIGAYSGIVRSAARRRQAVIIARTLHDSVEDDGAVDEAIRQLMKLDLKRRSWEFSLKQAVGNALQLVEDAANGNITAITTGLKELDTSVGGYWPGDLFVIGARPAMGKTAFLLNALDAASAAGNCCGLITTEQPNEQIGMRMLSISGKVSLQRLRTAKMRDDDWPMLTAAVAKLADRSVWMNDEPGPSIDDVIRQARRWHHEHGMKVLLVDYIQKIRGNPRDERHAQVATVVESLKNLARDLNIPVVALSQVKREVETRKDKRPNMGDMSDSSAIEKEADVVATLYRDEVYDPDSQFKGVCEISVEKNRHGPVGRVMAAWLGEFLRFENLAYGGEVYE